MHLWYSQGYPIFPSTGKKKMDNRILVLGYGAVGKALVARMLSEDRKVEVAQRSRPKELPAGVPFSQVDVLNAEQVATALKNTAQVVVALGFEYNSKLWKIVWPLAMRNILSACEANGTRLLFIDNLYMYGEQNEPLHENMPLTTYGAKPSIRSEISRMWMEAHASGKVVAAALRASDFYGPSVLLSQFGAESFGALANGKSAQLIAAPDVPHDFTYVPDIARAAISLLDADDEDYGQAWHVPNAPTKTPRQIIDLAAAALGVKPKVSALPRWMLPIIGIFIPILKEFVEINYQLHKPYRVDTSKFCKRFWSDVTPFEVGVPETAKSFQKLTLGS
jgi:nucleoside-diphosphate-sugar epimerase